MVQETIEQLRREVEQQKENIERNKLQRQLSGLKFQQTGFGQFSGAVTQGVASLGSQAYQKIEEWTRPKPQQQVKQMQPRPRQRPMPRRMAKPRPQPKNPYQSGFDVDAMLRSLPQ